MQDRPSGLATALELLGAGDVPREGEQASLFEAEAPLPLSAAKGVSGAKGGRPLGARNRRTEEMVAYLAGRYRMPLVGLLEIFARTPQDLACELKMHKAVRLADGTSVVVRDELDLEAAFKLQLSAMVAALPYLHQKLPLALDVKTKSAGVIVIGDVAGLATGDDGMLTLSIEQNQPLSGEPTASVGRAQSDEHSNSLESNDDLSRGD